MGGLRWLVDRLLSIGAYPKESETQRARRRIMLAAIWLASLLTALAVVRDFAAGRTWPALSTAAILVLTVVLLVGLHLRPGWFALLVNLLFGVVFAVDLIQTAMFGGLLGSGLVVAFGLIIVLAALVAFGPRAASWWFAGFVASVVYAVLIPNWIDPIYPPQPAADAAFNLVATAVVTFAVMLYFVRQRDRFQRQSDDLLHNILPDEIVSRLKSARTRIADSFESASVLFADVVGFTPMSAGMTPVELVTLLDGVFTSFDGFVEQWGLEKIKTVGDEYMVAAGVPRTRSDHAEAIAEFALRIRDHVAATEFEGRRIRLRIGINSGPVIAGIIGSHKFAYDLWGDVVNTASRMESEGLPGAIQVSAATYELIRDRFTCEPRGLIPVKGKGEMQTYILVSSATR
ncbi:MAG TPA: adenylate/guanylate cyclase domain-containing protein [Actinomycetota bacterium]|nr:adenylate/guanylate cyclase domain-containing protein [Actinomycetota bacterium]